MVSRKNKQKVVINNEELKPTTLFTIKEKKGNVFVLIFIFAIFLSVVYFLPNLSLLYEKYVKGQIGNNVIANKDSHGSSGGFNEEQEIKYILSENPIIENKELKINNITFADNNLSYSVNNTTGFEINFKNKKYFLEVYDISDVLVARIKIAEDDFAIDETKNYNYPVQAEGISYVLFKDLKVEDYPEESINLENGVGTLVCEKTDSQITYTFNNDGLTKIMETATFRTTDSDYATKLMNYQNKVSTYNSYTGVTSNISSVEGNIVYSITIDRIDNNTINKINSANYYNAKTGVNVVKFEMEARGYICK